MTMRDIVFRPETTLQRIVPFDDEALRAAFAVRAGDVPEIDASLLEADAEDAGNRRRKKVRRRSAQQVGRALTGALVGSRSASAATWVSCASSRVRGAAEHALRRQHQH